ncbi:MAG: hypothetical protein V1694_09620 [Candidatus Eisenbacteria bacterium]
MNDKAFEDEFEKLEEDVKVEARVQERRAVGRQEFRPLSLDELCEILTLTIKEDRVNKAVAFLCCVSAYTEESQFNISFNAPSATGKSYIPLEVTSFFPKADVIKVGYCSPTAFFHDTGVWDSENKCIILDLQRKILVFLD